MREIPKVVYKTHEEKPNGLEIVRDLRLAALVLFLLWVLKLILSDVLSVVF